jgi:transcriptional regulator with XRE-family HTH domain
MNTRLKQFLDAENISQSQFADTIKVVRASVSHVLSGRNNPSYDFIRAIMNSYPELNIEWLMLGKGKMYKAAQVEAPAPPVPTQMPALLFNDDDLIEDPIITAQESNIPVQQSIPSVSAQSSYDIKTSNDTKQLIVKQRNVSKIIVMFDDGTFQEM